MFFSIHFADKVCLFHEFCHSFDQLVTGFVNMCKKNHSLQELLSTETHKTFSSKEVRKTCSIFDKSVPNKSRPMLSASRPRK